MSAAPETLHSVPVETHPDPTRIVREAIDAFGDAGKIAAGTGFFAALIVRGRRWWIARRSLRNQELGSVIAAGIRRVVHDDVLPHIQAHAERAEARDGAIQETLTALTQHIVRGDAQQDRQARLILEQGEAILTVLQPELQPKTAPVSPIGQSAR